MSYAQVQYSEFLTHLPVTALDKTLMALKGHLLVEGALRTYIHRRIPHPKRIEDRQISFATLVDFASSLEDDKKIEWIWEALRLLNTIRNKLAHNLTPQKIEEQERKFISYVQRHDGELSIEVDSVQVQYGPFPLAMFQLYDTLISNSPQPARKKNPQDSLIAEAITKAFLAVEDRTTSNLPKRKKKGT